MTSLEARLAAARTQRTHLRQVVRELEDGGGPGGGGATGPFRDPAAAADADLRERERDSEIELARLEGELGWLRGREAALRGLQARLRESLGATRAARWLRGTVAAVAALLLAATAAVGVAATVLPRPAPVLPRAPLLQQRRASFVTPGTGGRCLDYARALLTRPRGASVALSAAAVSPAGLRVYAWNWPFRWEPGENEPLPASLADDEGWRYAVATRSWYGQTLVTLVGRNQTCDVTPGCFGTVHATCEPGAPDAAFDVLAAWLRAACDGKPAYDLELLAGSF